MSKKVIHAEVDEVIGKQSQPSVQKSAKKARQQAATPPSGFPDFDFSAFSGFTAGGGGFPRMSWRTRMMLRLASLAANPKIRRFLQKKWWPLWLPLGLLLIAFLIAAGILFLMWKFLRALISPYRDLFKRNP